MESNTTADEAQTETISALYDALDTVIGDEEWEYQGEPMFAVSDEEYDSLCEALETAQKDTSDEWSADECLYQDEDWSIVTSDADDVWGWYTDEDLDDEIVGLLQSAHNEAACNISGDIHIASAVEVFVYRR